MNRSTFMLNYQGSEYDTNYLHLFNEYFKYVNLDGVGEAFT